MAYRAWFDALLCRFEPEVWFFVIRVCRCGRLSLWCGGGGALSLRSRRPRTDVFCHRLRSLHALWGLRAPLYKSVKKEALDGYVEGLPHGLRQVLLPRRLLEEP